MHRHYRYQLRLGLLLKAVDIGGRVSANAAIVSSTVSSLANFNAVMTVDESGVFYGAKTNIANRSGALQLDGIDTPDAWDNFDEAGNFDLGTEPLYTNGSYYFASTPDLGAVYTSRLTARVNVAGLDYSNSIDTHDNMDAIEGFDQDIDPSLWRVQLEVRTTSDDPLASPQWSAWIPFVVGDYTARAFQFRLLMESYAAYVTPSISGLSVDIDMPDRTVSAGEIVSDSAGTTITFDTPFKALPAISITARNLASGDYYAIDAVTVSGFDIRFLNSAGTGVSRTFDYMAKGFGANTL